MTMSKERVISVLGASLLAIGMIGLVGLVGGLEQDGIGIATACKYGLVCCICMMIGSFVLRR